jgi:hypothetical protein
MFEFITLNIHVFTHARAHARTPKKIHSRKIKDKAQYMYV